MHNQELDSEIVSKWLEQVCASAYRAALESAGVEDGAVVDAYFTIKTPGARMPQELCADGRFYGIIMFDSEDKYPWTATAAFEWDDVGWDAGMEGSGETYSSTTFAEAVSDANGAAEDMATQLQEAVQNREPNYENPDAEPLVFWADYQFRLKNAVSA